MAIYKGNTKIVKLYKGNTQIVKRYKGTNLFYSASRLPSAFQEVEYLESTGTQYIDSNYLPKPNTKIIVEFEPISISVSDICSCFDNNTEFRRFRFIYINSQPLLKCDFGNTPTESNLGNTTPVIGTKYKVESYMGANSQSFKVNGYEETTNYSYNTSSSYSLYLFARNNNSVADNFSSQKLTMHKIYDNNILVRNFVPCYRKADNVAGLYDLVNGVFYTNAGTGTFIVGGNV